MSISSFVAKIGDDSSNLSIRYERCSWTTGSLWVEDQQQQVQENDYWYMDTAQSIVPHVAFSLYRGAENSCNRNNYLGSFYVDLDTFRSSLQERFGWQESDYSNYLCPQDGYGLGCSKSGDFVLQQYQMNLNGYPTCDANHVDGAYDTEDQLSSVNQDLDSVDCVQVYNSNLGTTIVESLDAASRQCTANDPECPHPFGIFHHKASRMGHNFGVRLDHAMLWGSRALIWGCLTWTIVLFIKELKATRRYRHKRYALRRGARDPFQESILDEGSDASSTFFSGSYLTSVFSASQKEVTARSPQPERKKLPWWRRMGTETLQRRRTPESPQIQVDIIKGDDTMISHSTDESSQDTNIMVETTKPGQFMEVEMVMSDRLRTLPFWKRRNGRKKDILGGLQIVDKSLPNADHGHYNAPSVLSAVNEADEETTLDSRTMSNQDTMDGIGCVLNTHGISFAPPIWKESGCMPVAADNVLIDTKAVPVPLPSASKQMRPLIGGSTISPDPSSEDRIILSSTHDDTSTSMKTPVESVTEQLQEVEQSVPDMSTSMKAQPVSVTEQFPEQVECSASIAHSLGAIPNERSMMTRDSTDKGSNIVPVLSDDVSSIDSQVVSRMRSQASATTYSDVPVRVPIGVGSYMMSMRSGSKETSREDLIDPETTVPDESVVLSNYASSFGSTLVPRMRSEETATTVSEGPTGGFLGFFMGSTTQKPAEINEVPQESVEQTKTGNETVKDTIPVQASGCRKVSTVLSDDVSSVGSQVVRRMRKQATVTATEEVPTKKPVGLSTFMGSLRNQRNLADPSLKAPPERIAPVTKKENATEDMSSLQSQKEANPAMPSDAVAEVSAQSTEPPTNSAQTQPNKTTPTPPSKELDTPLTSNASDAASLGKFLGATDQKPHVAPTTNESTKKIAPVSLKAFMDSKRSGR